MGKFTTLKVYISEEERSKLSLFHQISCHLRKLQRKQKINAQARRGKEIKNRADVNEIKKRKSIETITKIKAGSLKISI